VIELVSGTPAPAGYRLLMSGVAKYGGQNRLTVDVYVKQ
jgi:hypothetical protein